MSNNSWLLVTAAFPGRSSIALRCIFAQYRPQNLDLATVACLPALELLGHPIQLENPSKRVVPMGGRLFKRQKMRIIQFTWWRRANIGVHGMDLKSSMRSVDESALARAGLSVEHESWLRA